MSLRELPEAAWQRMQFGMIVGDSTGPIARSRHLEPRWRRRVVISAGVAARDLVFCLQIAENARSLTPTRAHVKARARFTGFGMTNCDVASCAQPKGRE